MINQQDRAALSEILVHARALGDDEIALDCEAALRGDHTAMGYVRLTTQQHADYTAWRAEQ